jgi:hypothetical protein
MQRAMGTTVLWGCLAGPQGLSPSFCSGNLNRVRLWMRDCYRPRSAGRCCYYKAAGASLTAEILSYRTPLSLSTSNANLFSSRLHHTRVSKRESAAGALVGASE